MCHVMELNLSYDCLTGYAVRDRLCNLKKTDPEFWKELTSASVPESTNTDQTFKEDNVDGPDMFFNDDSDLPCNTIIGCVTGSVIPENVSSTADGDFVLAAQAELMDSDDDSETGNAVPVVEEDFGPRKRKRQANTLYTIDTFWCHHDNDDPNDDLGA